MDYNIYLDVFFFLNFTMNLVLIAGCGRIFFKKFSFKNSIVAAALGAAVAAVVLLFQLDLTGIRFFTAMAMGRVAYGKENPGKCIQNGLILSFAAFSLDGAARWLYESTKKGMTAWGIQGKEAFFYLLAGSFLSFGLFGFIHREKKEQDLLIPVKLSFRGRDKVLTGLYDTGNHLTEPVSGKPVHIAEYEAMKELIPETYQEVIENYFKTGTLEVTKVTKLQMYEFTLLSYHSIGNEKGQLLGIRMDSADFMGEAGEKTEDKVVIGLTTQKLSKRGRYQMIINRRLEL